MATFQMTPRYGRVYDLLLRLLMSLYFLLNQLRNLIVETMKAQTLLVSKHLCCSGFGKITFHQDLNRITSMHITVCTD